MLTRSLVVALFLVACRDGDPGFEIVKVPLSAYASPDASAKNDAGQTVATDAGPDPIVLCVPKPESDKDDEETNGDDCPNEYQGRAYDEKATARHRSKGDDSTVCCYRKGRLPHRTPAEVE